MVAVDDLGRNVQRVGDLADRKSGLVESCDLLFRRHSRLSPYDIGVVPAT